MSILHGLVILSLVIFIAAIVARAVRIMRTPIHLRWELYPVPHEKGRAAHGGSMLEETDWWTKSKDKDHLGELGVMIPEILLLKGVWEHNRKLWFSSWGMHFGLYLLIGHLALVTLLGILGVAGLDLSTGFLSILVSLLKALAIVGGALGLLGSVILFVMRLSDNGMKRFASPSHFVNLIHLGAIYLTTLLWALLDPQYALHSVGLLAGLVSFGEIPALPVVGYVNIAVVLLFFVYLPFTHMTHFFTKYFTYHEVRWEDEPNMPGGPLEGKIAAAVSQPVTWAAPHIGADGKKNWVDLVSGTGKVDDEKKEA
ncbi:hypothetical protein GF324_03870 [bacterium]|nr:hypothetical protein [bacterium]